MKSYFKRLTHFPVNFLQSLIQHVNITPGDNPRDSSFTQLVYFPLIIYDYLNVAQSQIGLG